MTPNVLQSRLEKVLEVAIAVVRLLSESPEQVKLSVHSGEGHGVVLQVEAPRKQLGNIIGSTGRNARSLRILMVAMMAPEKQNVSLNILAIDDEDGV